MPKMKSKSTATKRFSLTATGKLKYKRSHARHILTKKSTKRKRQLRKAKMLYSPIAKNIKVLLQG